MDVDKLKTVPVDLKELRDVVSKEVVKKSKFYKVNSKVNKLENNNYFDSHKSIKH